MLLQKLSSALVESLRRPVFMAPGRITDNDILRRFNSILKEKAYLSRAAFVIAYIPVKGSGSRGANSLVMIIMRPPCITFN